MIKMLKQILLSISDALPLQPQVTSFSVSFLHLKYGENSRSFLFVVSNYIARYFQYWQSCTLLACICTAPGTTGS